MRLLVKWNSVWRNCFDSRTSISPQYIVFRTVTCAVHCTVWAIYFKVYTTTLQFYVLQVSTVQCGAVLQCSTMQCIAVRYNAVQCSDLQYSTMQCSAIQCDCQMACDCHAHMGGSISVIPGHMAHCKLYIELCTLYTVHCTLYTVHCTLYTVHCTLYTVHCTLYTVQQSTLHLRFQVMGHCE